MRRPLVLVHLLERAEAAHVLAHELARIREPNDPLAHVVEELADIVWKLVELEERRS